MIVNTTHKADGLELFNSLGQPGLLVVYDSPNPTRILYEREVFADIFHLSHYSATH